MTVVLSGDAATRVVVEPTVTSYPVIALPPYCAGAVQPIVSDELVLPVTVTEAGAPGTTALVVTVIDVEVPLPALFVAATPKV